MINTIILVIVVAVPMLAVGYILGRGSMIPKPITELDPKKKTKAENKEKMKELDLPKPVNKEGTHKYYVELGVLALGAKRKGVSKKDIMEFYKTTTQTIEKYMDEVVLKEWKYENAKHRKDLLEKFKEEFGE